MGDPVRDALASRYVLFSCEGTAEGVIIEKLVGEDRLTVPRNHVVKDPRTFRWHTRLRKSADIAARFLQQNYSSSECDGLLLARIVDSRTARFSLPRHYREMVLVESFIAAPEIEMLVIHNEARFEDWSKRSSKMKPSDYCKQVLGYKEVKQEGFLREYWSDVDKLERSIREYESRHKKRTAQEHSLADLLR